MASAFQFDLNVEYNHHEEEAGHEDYIMSGQGQQAFDLNQRPESGTDSGDEEQQQQHHHNQHSQQTQKGHHQQRKRLSSNDKLQILHCLLEHTKRGKLEHGRLREAAAKFNLTRRTISKIWKTAKQQKAANQPYNMATNHHNCGRKRVQIDVHQLREVGIGDRSCHRDIAEKFHVSKSTINRMVKRGQLKPHTNALKPKLTPENKKERLRWVLQHLIGDTPETKRVYQDMYNTVHSNEKWFHLTRKTQRAYLAPEEQGPHRCGQSSKFIPKLMFIALVAKPWLTPSAECVFDGRLGIFPFIKRVPAQRNSKYRKKGELVTKLIPNITREISRKMLIEEVIPAIMEKWPNTGTHQHIYIQQDNAKAHITQSDPVWQQHCQQPGFTFHLVQQPPNTPDLNILDLGFFRSIQSLQHKKMPRNVDQLIDAVNASFYELDSKTLFKVWVTLQDIMNAILKAKGSNKYSVPHRNKNRLDRQGRLQEAIQAPMWAVMEAWDIVYADTPMPVSDNEGEAFDYTQEGQADAQAHSQISQVFANDHEASTSRANDNEVGTSGANEHE